MNKILRNAPILFLISFSLIGCTSKNNQFLKKSSIKYLTEAKTLFMYNRVEGFDASGPIYAVLDFSNSDKKEEFLNQFYNEKENVNELKSGTNAEFEISVNEFVQNKLGVDYLSFDKQYQIDFEKPYSYYWPGESYIGTALIYYAESSVAYYLHMQMNGH